MGTSWAEEDGLTESRTYVPEKYVAPEQGRLAIQGLADDHAKELFTLRELDRLGECPHVRFSCEERDETFTACIASQKPRRYLSDSGATFDMLDPNDLGDEELAGRRPGNKVRVNSASGPITISEVVPLRLQSLDVQMEPYLVKGSPPVSAMGRRCMIDGCGLLWEPYSSCLLYTSPSPRD